MSSAPLPTRRQFVLAMGVGLIGAACSRGAPSARAGSIAALIEGASVLSVLGAGADTPPTTAGTNRLGFLLVDAQNRFIQGGSPDVWIARDETSRALGPFPAVWHTLSAFEKSGDQSPRTSLRGVFASEIDFPTRGKWTVAVILQNGSRRLAGTGRMTITSGPVVAGLGTRAVSTPTPVATATSDIEAICTRIPVDHMHYISLDQALSNHKPTVVCFSTPMLCTSRLCGPVTDEQILVFEQYGSDRANFIHVEEFLPGPDHTPPPPTPDNLSPAFKAWKLETEPWVFVIDREGIIRFRALGPVTAPEIEAALKALL